jgi:formylglycine-generating enzyme required for sulfatase activity
MVRFRQFACSHNLPKKVPNIGFKDWTPTAVNNKEVQFLGDNWEWTETIWDKYEGFQASTIYPGYSADFFDGKHRVVLGGSWATHPRISERTTFRNWYQSGYPYVFSGFRLCF